VLSWGRRFRVLAIVDDFTREALALIVDSSIGGRRVVRELDALIARRGRPAMIVSDNGTELTSRAVLEWTNRTGTLWHYIAPGKPTQNAFVESFIGRYPRRVPSVVGGWASSSIRSIVSAWGHASVRGRCRRMMGIEGEADQAKRRARGS
jgi:putative transposase